MEELRMDDEIIFALIGCQNKKNIYFLKILEKYLLFWKIIICGAFIALQIIKCNKMKIIYDTTEALQKKIICNFIRASPLMIY